jgi:sugar/nucleoside kinase (ribokinase family)
MNLEIIKKLLKKMNDWGCPLIIATRGKDGVILYDGNKYFEFKPELVEAIDTLGAGDSFAAGFLINYLQIKNIYQMDSYEGYVACIEASMKKGAEMSAKTCMTYGAFGCGTDLI